MIKSVEIKFTRIEKLTCTGCRLLGVGLHHAAPLDRLMLVLLFYGLLPERLDLRKFVDDCLVMHFELVVCCCHKRVGNFEVFDEVFDLLGRQRSTRIIAGAGIETVYVMAGDGNLLK